MGMIPHLEYGIGAFFPKGGMIRITESLQELALELGVEIRTGVAVESIQTSGKKAIGIKTDRGVFDCDVLVSAVDVSLTYNRLLGKKSRAEKYSRLPKSTSAIIWYWGIGRQTPQTGLHNIFFSSDYPKEFHQLFGVKTMPDEPSIYLNISSKENPADAPEGKENWFVMVNAPANEGQDWDNLLAESRKFVLQKLSTELGFAVEDFIEAETVLDPRSLESRTGGVGGALYGNNSNHPFAAFYGMPILVLNTATCFFVEERCIRVVESRLRCKAPELP
jgi:phytoene dehydrogenase-like protein